MNINIVSFWQQLITQWEAENKCGLCWHFEAPLKESQNNIIQVPEGKECCVMVMLTDIRESETPTFSPNTNLLNGINHDHGFTIHFVMQGDLGTNNFTEIKGHPESEGRWNTIYEPIKTCIDDTGLLEAFCLYLGVKVDVTTWSKEISHAYLDNNYFGWKIRAIFRIEE